MSKYQVTGPGFDHEACKLSIPPSKWYLFVIQYSLYKLLSLFSPIHDAVEYDYVEMVRLLLSCGADPMLSKFSGRAVRDMIRGQAMKIFLSSKSVKKS